MGGFKMLNDKKVILILVDGMRPDSIDECKHPFVNKLIEKSSYILNAQTVMPSVTLPCHMSLFHSARPQRHGILTNTYVPQVRPINGLFEQLKKADKKCASFYNWEQLRDISRPGSLVYSCFVRMIYEGTDKILTDNLIKFSKSYSPDFSFLYLGETDGIGHKIGWMTDEYIETVYNAWECIEEVYNKLSNDYSIVVTADHGGHEQLHGTEMPEDMTIPLIFNGPFNLKNNIEDVNIIDIAPTIAKFMGIQLCDDWEGKSLI